MLDGGRTSRCGCGIAKCWLNLVRGFGLVADVNIAPAAHEAEGQFASRAIFVGGALGALGSVARHAQDVSGMISVAAFALHVATLLLFVGGYALHVHIWGP